MDLVHHVLNVARLPLRHYRRVPRDRRRLLTCAGRPRRGCAAEDSNPQRLGCRPSALTVELAAPGTPGRDRTCDPVHIRDVLYQLSYKRVVEVEGIEPPASEFAARRSVSPELHPVVSRRWGGPAWIGTPLGPWRAYGPRVPPACPPTP